VKVVFGTALIWTRAQFGLRLREELTFRPFFHP